MVKTVNITTHTKKLFDPLAARPEDIDIRDVAHSLSLLCRANGHFPHFYSVGQHCLCCMREAAARGYSRRVQLGCLLHDAGEAYLSDVIRPIKAQMPEYAEREAVLQDLIFGKWITPSLTEEERGLIFGIDDDMLYYEFLNLMGVPLWEEPRSLATAPSLACVPFADVEKAYVEAWQSLTQE